MVSAARWDLGHSCGLTLYSVCVALLAGRKRKKSSAVRQLLMYRKNLATLLEEAVSTRCTPLNALWTDR